MLYPTELRGHVQRLLRAGLPCQDVGSLWWCVNSALRHAQNGNSSVLILPPSFLRCGQSDTPLRPERVQLALRVLLGNMIRSTKALGTKPFFFAAFHSIWCSLMVDNSRRRQFALGIYRHQAGRADGRAWPALQIRFRIYAVDKMTVVMIASYCSWARSATFRSRLFDCESFYACTAPLWLCPACSASRISVSISRLPFRSSR